MKGEDYTTIGDLYMMSTRQRGIMMWIRSQDRKFLSECKLITITSETNTIADVNNYFRKLGEYATEKRCLEVLDEIQMAIISGKKAFLMPEE